MEDFIRLDAIIVPIIIFFSIIFSVDLVVLITRLRFDSLLAIDLLALIALKAAIKNEFKQYSVIESVKL